MKKIFYVFIIALFCALTASGVGAHASASKAPIKMSRSGICHAPGTTYYTKTKKFTPYATMQDCLNAGGRRPRR